jgi:hypothetical protein
VEGGEGVGGEIPLEDSREGRGIVKTVETTVVVDRSDGSREGGGRDRRDRSGWEV